MKINCGRILVIGETGIDEYLEGQSSRLSPENGTPVVGNTVLYQYPGLAANLAEACTSYHAEVRLVSVLGDDADAARLIELSSANLSYVVDPTRPTIKKRRLLVNGEDLARFDTEDTKPLNPDIATALDELIDATLADLRGRQAVLLQDYGKGFWTVDRLQRVFRLCNEVGIPTFVDPCPTRPLSHYVGATVMKMNEKEAMQLLDVSRPFELAEHIQEITNCQYAVVTAGDGITKMCSDDRKVYLINPTVYGAVACVAGAGDVVMATLACTADQPGDNTISPVVWLKLSLLAAGLAVAKPRTAVVTSQELYEAARQTGVLTEAELKEVFVV